MEGFNKMFVMLPLMFLARKIDGEDPQIVYMLRIAYFSIQAIIMGLVLYVYVQACAAAKGKEDKTIFVPPAATPFTDPDAKKKYNQTTFGTHLTSQARSLVASTLFGIALTTGLHIFRGMVVGLAIQAIMGPMNLMENALIKALFMGKGLHEEDKIFDEKLKNELTADDEIVDESGNPIANVQVEGKASGDSGSSSTFEELMLDTWDAGSKAELGPFMQAITKKNCNYPSKENSWTPLMVLSGLGVKGSASTIRQVLELGGNPATKDVEGWNAMHWAAFHGSADAAKVLRDVEGKLYKVKDKEGKTPLDHARAEGNDDVAKILEELEKSGSTTEAKTDDGLRKRK